MIHRIKESFFLFFSLILLCNHCIAAIEPPTPIAQKLTPGFFYRQSASNIKSNVEGVYARSVDYYGENLFADIPNSSIKTHVFSQTITSSVKNWMGVVFFGIWSYPKEEGGESVKIIKIPVRTLNASNRMTYMSDGKRMFKSRCIWRTGGGAEAIKDVGGYKFRHIPSAGGGGHTENKFGSPGKRRENVSYNLGKAQNSWINLRPLF